MGLTTHSVAILLCIGVPSLVAASESEQNSSVVAPPESVLPEIAEKQTDPHRVAFLLHEGTYWTIGRDFSRVREFMRAHELPGPMYIRYSTDLRTFNAQSPGTEIGFFIGDDFAAEPPYQTARRNGERVVWLAMDAPTATISRYVAMLSEWADANGFAAGPLTEIYSIRLDGSEDFGPVQIQMAIEAKPEPVVPVQSAMAVQETDVAHVLPAIELRDAPSVDIQSTGHSEDDGPKASFADLAGQGRFDLIAELALPVSAHKLPGFSTFLESASLRIRAIAGTITRKHPDESGPISALGGAIERRAAHLLGLMGVESSDQRSVAPSGDDDPVAVEMRAILRDLDAIMMKIGLERMDASATLDQLLDVVRRTAEMTDSIAS